MISTIVPSYKNPKCLETCIQSFLDTNNCETNEMVCVIDGYEDLYNDLIEKYHKHINFSINAENQGMPFSINMGVFHAINKWILVINDDNVFPKDWDNILSKYQYENLVISPNQIEAQQSIFNFVQYDFGDIDSFRYQEFLNKEPEFRDNSGLTNDGEIFPFHMSKKTFMACGGFDLIYPSPFVCDWDFFLKLELLGMQFARTREINFYHFGSVATKQSKNKEDSESFKISENIAAQIFAQKWGFAPVINRPSNSHLPHDTKEIKGIQYE